MKHVVIFGGTGLLGYHSTLEFLNRGYSVTSVSLPPMPVEDLFPQGVENILADLTELSDARILEILDGASAVVYAAGADERTVPDAPAAKYFYEQNVLPVQRVARLAVAAGVKKFVLFNSYTAEFAEIWPDLGYRKHNGYPRTRLMQEEAAIMEGYGAMDVMSLRLPYIFGTMPGRIPLWQMFLDIARSQPERVVTQLGSTSSVTVKQVAQATVGAVEHGEHGGKYPINGYNLRHTEFMALVCEALGRSKEDVVGLPYELFVDQMQALDDATAASGKEHGIHLVDSTLFNSRDAVSDQGAGMEALGYEPDDIPASIRETLKYCLDHELVAQTV